MARYPHDGRTKVYFVLAIANMAAPTVAELDAGTDLTEGLPKDGLTVPAEQNNVPDDALADTFDGQIPGTFGGVISGMLKRDNDTDTYWDLVEYGLEGYVVVRRGPEHDDAWAIGDEVEVYPGSFHEPVMQQTATNTQARFAFSFPVRSPGPELKAVVA